MDFRLRGLYAITDEHLIAAEHFTEKTELALKGGAAIIQYRDKSHDTKKRLTQAKALRQLCNQYNALLIINDDIKLASAVNADGIHLGEDDTAIKTARNKLGDDAIIGVSCYNQLSLGHIASQAGADYVAFGSFFNSPTKPAARTASIDCLAQAKQQLDIPVCAIGGINLDNAASLISLRADMIAVISGVFAQQDITGASGSFVKLFNSANQ